MLQTQTALLFWLQAPTIFLRRHSQLLFAIAAEVRQGLKIHHLSNLRNGETLVVEQVLEYGHGMAVDIRGDAVTRHSADSGRQVFGRDVEPPGIIAHLALGAADSRREQIHQTADNIARPLGMPGGAVMLGVKLKNIVHHDQAETSHDSVVETQVGFVHTLTDTAYVG